MVNETRGKMEPWSWVADLGEDEFLKVARCTSSYLETTGEDSTYVQIARYTTLDDFTIEKRDNKKEHFELVLDISVRSPGVKRKKHEIRLTLHFSDESFILSIKETRNTKKVFVIGSEMIKFARNILCCKKLHND